MPDSRSRFSVLHGPVAPMFAPAGSRPRPSFSSAVRRLLARPPVRRLTELVVHPTKPGGFAARLGKSCAVGWEIPSPVFCPGRRSARGFKFPDS